MRKREEYEMLDNILTYLQNDGNQHIGNTVEKIAKHVGADLDTVLYYCGILSNDGNILLQRYGSNPIDIRINLLYPGRLKLKYGGYLNDYTLELKKQKDLESDKDRQRRKDEWAIRTDKFTITVAIIGGIYSFLDIVLQIFTGKGVFAIFTH